MNPEKLSSWKEIASFLGVTVKTAQRWEKLRGLPVQRIPGGVKGGVYAIRSDIESWLDRGGAEESTADKAQSAQVTARRRLLWAGSGAGLVLAGLAGLTTMGVSVRPALGSRFAKAGVRGTKVVGLDESGEVLWEHSFGHDLDLPQPVFGWPHWLRTVRWPGAPEPLVVAAVRWSPDSSRYEYRVACFSLDGKLNWDWTPEVPLHDYDGKAFEKQWLIEDMLVETTPAGPMLWLSVSNPLRWASALFQIGMDGRRKLQFANAGSIQRLAAAKIAGESRLYATGVNNAWGQPFLAATTRGDPPSMSPPLGAPRYIYSDAPREHMQRYILFPGSEINAASVAPYFHIGALSVLEDRVLVEAMHLGTQRVAMHYEFDFDLRPMLVRPTASWAPIHRQLEAAGHLKHSLEECPENGKRWEFRSWHSKKGWTTLCADSFRVGGKS